MASKVTKVFTGYAGLPVCKEPHKELLRIYSRVLRSLEALPKDSKYRMMTEKAITEKQNVVQTNSNPEDIEKKLGGIQCEELIEQAKLELKLVHTMNEFKPWEPLVEKPEPNQWKWPL